MCVFVYMSFLTALLGLVGCRCPSHTDYGDAVYHLPRAYNFKDQSRRFRIHVPPGYQPASPNPVVLLLHGSGGSEEKIRKATGYQELSDREGFLLVLGEGVTDGWPERRKESRSWNSGLCCSTPWINDVDDVAYVRAVLTMVHARYCTSPDQVFIAGHGNGGMMAYRLACELSDHVTGIAVNAGSLVQHDYRACLRTCHTRDPPGAAVCFNKYACSSEVISRLPQEFPCKMSKPVSILHIHGELDPNVPYYGGLGHKNLGNATFLPVKTLLKEFAKRYSCNGHRSVTLENPSELGTKTVSCQTFEGCYSSRIELCKLPSGGHHVPGSPLPPFCRQGSDRYKAVWCRFMLGKLGPISNAISFADQSWNFFKSISGKSRAGTKGPRSAYTKSSGNTIMLSCLYLHIFVVKCGHFVWLT